MPLGSVVSGIVMLKVGVIVVLVVAVVALVALCAHLYRSLRKATASLDELITQNKDMEAAAKARGEFLASMNHEIRTPMNALTSFIDILAQRTLQSCSAETKEETEGVLDIIKKSSNDILTITDDVFDYIKIDANLLEIESVPMSIKQVIHDVSHVEKPNVIAKNLDLSVKYRGVIPPTILSDPVRIRQILTHLVTNAIKFTDKGSITVLCEVLDDGAAKSAPANETDGKRQHSFSASSKQLRISVTDTGTGVSPEHIQDLFRPVKHSDSSLLRSKRGSGLGLNIAMRLATLLDGTITVESTLGQGSTFSLLLNVYVPEGTFPVLPEHKDSEVIPHEESRVHAGLDIRKPKDRSGEPEGENQPLQNVRVLVVEDVLVNQVVVATLLRDAGAQVELADNGAMAIQKVMQDQDNGLFFDVILMDVRMPVMDGYEATAYLRKYDYRHPIIAVTALSSASDREKTLEVGCNDYISKPIDNQALINMIKKYVDADQT